MQNYIRPILGVACIICNLHPRAQNLSLEYDTELQTNFKGDYNWANLLRLSASLDLSEHFTIGASTISIARTAGEPIIDDLQGYSNIDEENLPLGIAHLGVEYHNRRSTFFLGIRNVGEDYFTTPVTSLFVNSSCGIFPTISANYDIANYPLSSWCLHYMAQWDQVTLRASLYEGLGHRRIAGRDNVFIFSPRRDGIFSITSVEYDHNGSNYSLGCAVYYGVHHRDELLIEEEDPAPASKKTLSAAPWVNVEQRLTDTSSLLLQAACSTRKTDCRYYFGAGATYEIGRAQLGIFSDYAKYTGIHEIATELTCCVTLTKMISLQPTFELIHTGSNTNAVGILRLSLTI